LVFSIIEVVVTFANEYRLNKFMPRQTEHNLRAERREVRKRPRMKVAGAALKRVSKFAGLKAAKKKK
jgi:hypothetical protein